jgi:hypothetical protein
MFKTLLLVTTLGALLPGTPQAAYAAPSLALNCSIASPAIDCPAQTTDRPGYKSWEPNLALLNGDHTAVIAQDPPQPGNTIVREALIASGSALGGIAGTPFGPFGQIIGSGLGAAGGAFLYWILK